MGAPRSSMRCRTSSRRILEIFLVYPNRAADWIARLSTVQAILRNDAFERIFMEKGSSAALRDIGMSMPRRNWLAETLNRSTSLFPLRLSIAAKIGGFQAAKHPTIDCARPLR